MAPRKRTSSGGKKPSNPNGEPQQSQPPKFGIQHFFERHSQTQSQKTPGSGDPVADSAANRNSRIVAKPIVKGAEVGAGNAGGVASLAKIESRTEYMRAENPRSNSVNAIVNDVNDAVSRNAKSRSDVPVVDHIGLRWESSTKSFDDGVVDAINVEKAENLLKAEVTTRSQDTLPDNLLPVGVDDEEKQLEVTPETSKSASVKRFKFSPGMVIVVTSQIIGLSFCGLWLLERVHFTI